MAERMKVTGNCLTSCSTCAPESCPQRSRRAPKLSDGFPKVAPGQPRLGPHSTKSGRLEPSLSHAFATAGQDLAKIDQHWPSWSHICRLGPKVSRLGPNLDRCQPTSVKLHRSKLSPDRPSWAQLDRPKIGQTRPSVLEMCQMLAAKVGQQIANTGQNSSKLGRISAPRAIARHLLDNSWTTSVLADLTWGNFPGGGGREAWRAMIWQWRGSSGLA